MSRKAISVSTRAELLRSNQCANVPNMFAAGCKDYICPMWSFNGGFFDESGYEIDHIIEYSHGGGNEIDNLQLLCPSCHSVKTKRCAKQKWNFNSLEIDEGRSMMEQDNRPPKKKKNSVDFLQK